MIFFRAWKGYEKFQHVRGHSQVDSPAWSIKPETSRIFFVWRATITWYIVCVDDDFMFRDRINNITIVIT